ncbi:MAG: Flp pilus assembly complex ATPase component TadA [Deltaproteobacteria bacterium]|jgi:general secretion pathway protein E|nr:Flp pilus assembly complex ATPase component TadA [Deltaproteobacteria bacterium]MDA8158785.1 ATPase, T2SS/T4P/T4SS family [Deltaproteobacteria bacterium]
MNSLKEFQKLKEFNDENVRRIIRKNFSSIYLKKNLILPVPLQDNSLCNIFVTQNTKNFDVVSDVLMKLDIADKNVVVIPEEELINLINSIYDTSLDSIKNSKNGLGGIKGVNGYNGEDGGEWVSDGGAGGTESGSGPANDLKSFEHIDLIDENSEAPAIKFINVIILEALKENASDIHIEPFQDYLSVKFRTDGSLNEKLRPHVNLKNSIVSRIKVMAGLDIAEKRLPQDGRIQLVARNKNIDIRVSIVPTIFGERVVLRLLDKSLNIYDITEVGIDEKFLPSVKTALSKTTGMVISTGPTGSGKTTTLYSFINEVMKLYSDKNILTIEDPVEYQIKGISQINVNNKIGLTFAKGLRHILRQDPDVIMIGEIRDSETAEIAIQSAMTGHLVLSTLHTNDSASAFARLTDMGIEPFLIASSISIVFAQRLLRKLCPDCRESYEISGEDVKLLISDEQSEIMPVINEILSRGTFYTQKGCKECNFTGYKGRTAIYEILEVNDDIRSLIMTRASSQEIKLKAVKFGMSTLRVEAIRKFASGLTSIAEVVRVSEED